MSDQPPAIFFDFSSLGLLSRSPGSVEPERLEPYPQVRGLLEHLRAQDVRLGVLGGPHRCSEQGMLQLLERSGLASLFGASLVISGGDGVSAQVTRAVEAAGHATSPSRCVFVGEDRDERAGALAAGLRVAPHAKLAAAGLCGEHLQYLRLTVPDEHVREDWRPRVAELDVVPLRVAAESAAVSYAIATSAAAASLDDLGFQVYRLGAEDAPLTTELYLLRDDRQTRTGFLEAEGASAARFGSGEYGGRVLASTREGLYVAIEAGRSVDSYHFEEASHGHTEKLVPTRSLLEPVEPPPAVASLSSGGEEPVLGDDERRALAQISPTMISSDLPRYTGKEPVDATGTRIRSRHVSHRDNAVAVEALARDLEAIGDGQLDVKIHLFGDERRPSANVEAELRGSEPGDLVLVTAHLDSTAMRSQPYDAGRDPAPGADDDASGCVAVLALAHALVRLREVKPLKRTIRFVLFNAEEVGLVGSKAYAAAQAALGARIVAVFQMDMIGYNVEPPSSYEVHVGFLPSPEIEERSAILGERIARAAREVSPNLPAPQIFRTLRTQNPPVKDPGDDRSDHRSFQERGYPACLTIEDYFGGPGADPVAEQNPNYHMLSDEFVDADYAADIARAIGGAALLTANM